LLSLYIFSTLAGADISLNRLASLLAGKLALAGLLLLGFAPAVWIFTQGISSFGFMGFLALASWGVATAFGLRFLFAGIREHGARSGMPLAIWAIIFLLVGLQLTATQLKSATADVFDLMLREGAVAVCRHDKPRGVLLSIEKYEALTERDPDWLDDLKHECAAMLDAMQSPEQKAAAIRLFEATPEELGEAAVRGVQRRIATGEIIP